MKTTLSTLAAALLLALPAYADDAHHPGQKAAPAASAPAPAPAAKAPAVKAPTVGAPLKRMQANVKTMRAQLERIGKTTGEEARRRLLAEHLQTLQESMMLGKEMADDDHCSMMDGGMAMHGHPGMGMMAPGNGMMERMQQMEKRIDMMQMMIEQMGKTQPMPAPIPAPAR